EALRRLGMAGRRIALACEREIKLEVTRFGTLERRVELGERLRQPRYQQTKALGGARFDQRADEQHVELAAGVLRAHRGAQARRISPRLLPEDRDAERLHHALHLLEVPKLLAREARQRCR